MLDMTLGDARKLTYHTNTRHSFDVIAYTSPRQI